MTYIKGCLYKLMHSPCKFYLHTQYGKEASSVISTKGTRHSPNSGSHMLLCPIDRETPDDIWCWDEDHDQLWL